MDYRLLSFLPLVIAYILWTIHAIKHLIKGDYLEYIDVSIWMAVTFYVLLILCPVLTYDYFK